MEPIEVRWARDRGFYRPVALLVGLDQNTRPQALVIVVDCRIIYVIYMIYMS